MSNPIRGRVYCRKESNRFSRKGYIYCWYYEVVNADTGNVLASDNTADFHGMLDNALRDVSAIRHCAKLGILRKSRGW